MLMRMVPCSQPVLWFECPALTSDALWSVKTQTPFTLSFFYWLSCTKKLKPWVPLSIFKVWHLRWAASNTMYHKVMAVRVDQLESIFKVDIFNGPMLWNLVSQVRKKAVVSSLKICPLYRATLGDQWEYRV